MYFPVRFANTVWSSENGSVWVLPAVTSMGAQNFVYWSISVSGFESMVMWISVHGWIVKPELVWLITSRWGIFGIVTVSSFTWSIILFSVAIFLFSCGKKNIWTRRESERAYIKRRRKREFMKNWDKKAKILFSVHNATECDLMTNDSLFRTSEEFIGWSCGHYYNVWSWKEYSFSTSSGSNICPDFNIFQWIERIEYTVDADFFVSKEGSKFP